MPAPLSVIIPTLNAAEALPETAHALLEGATDGLIRDLVISDGGSSDDTRTVAAELGALRVDGPKGRGGQIARGVAATDAPWLLVLHADTHLSAGWSSAVRTHMNGYPDHAGYFRLRFRADGLAPKAVAMGANLRSRHLDLPYGDQGLLVSRSVLQEVGGFPDMPLMEDVEIARRLRGRLRGLDAEAWTSAERYLQEGWTRRVSRNLGTLMRYMTGTPPDRLTGRYGRQ
jgi:rSAM/selenodomain-associated transferase 2